MLKKRFFLFLALFSFLIVIFNFSLVSASLNGVTKIRLLSLSIILSIFEITVAAFVFWVFFRSATGFKKREHQLSLILNNTEPGILVHSALNEILFLNSRAEEILGITFKDIVGVRFSKESSIRNKKMEKVAEVLFFSKLNSNGDKNFTVETKEVSDAGHLFFIKTLKKSTETTNAQSEIEFVTTVAHQLRTPLSGIKWVFKMLLENPNLSQEHTSLLKRGQDTNEKVIKIINDLLDTAKIESGKFTYDFKSIDPVSFVESLISDFSPLANKNNIRLIFDKNSESVPNVKADSDRLGMVFGNLLDNAIKYTSGGGEVKVSLVRRNNFVEILVYDTGIGIPETERGKIFSKFFRAENAAKMDFGGVGLGLFIAYRIISDHGGQMRFTPNSPTGSIFSFTIPLSDRY